MQYQNVRGGRVKLHPIINPPSEFEHPEKGDALYAMEIALSLEKLTNEKLLNLHKVARQNNDPEMQHYIESEFLEEQVSSKVLFFPFPGSNADFDMSKLCEGRKV
uniref:Ferritin n=1 Tax=Rhizophora mucronata TaxID=61149 RepID=A0A2P2KC54_RHIMU